MVLHTFVLLLILEFAVVLEDDEDALGTCPGWGDVARGGTFGGGGPASVIGDRRKERSVGFGACMAKVPFRRGIY